MQPIEELALRISAIEGVARSGLGWANGYDRERYERIIELVGEMAAIVSSPVEFDSQLAEDLKQGWLTQVTPGNLGYVTPKLTTMGTVIKTDEDGQERILLIQRSDSATWRLPSGFNEVGISPANNVVKEVAEETGIEVEPVRIIGLLDSVAEGWPRQGPNSLHITGLNFLCKMVGGELKPHPLEVLDVGFYTQTEAEKLAGPYMTPFLQRVFDAYHGNLDVYFTR